MRYGLRGFVAQGMNGLRKSVAPFVAQYPPGSYTFTAPRSGDWKFVLWGAGGQGSATPAGGGSGAYVEVTRKLVAGQSVALVVGGPNDANNTSATFPGGVVVTAARGADASSGGAGGVATGGDVRLNGSAGGTGGGSGGAGSGTGGGASGGANGGGGAPGVVPFRGGFGGSAVNTVVGSPGGGGANGGGYGGSGLLIVMQPNIQPR